MRATVVRSRRSVRQAGSASVIGLIMLHRLIHGVLLANLLLIGSGAMLYVHERADHERAAAMIHVNTSREAPAPSDEPGDDCPICHLLLTARAVPTFIAAFIGIDAPPPSLRSFADDGRNLSCDDVRTLEARGPPLAL
jgi:hypothetical protein